MSNGEGYAYRVEAPTCVSVCSGVGGMDLGLARAGFRHILFAESESYRRDVLHARFPGITVVDDIRAVGVESTKRVQDDAGRPRAGATRWVHPEPVPGLVCGGTPCQDLSVAGQRRGLAGDRSSLFFEYSRVVDALRPRWLLWENVPGAFSSNGGRDFGVVLGTLADIGYGLAWRLLDSRYFGVPQRRRRVFVVGALVDSDPRGAVERAGEVLAVGSRCPRHPATRGKTGQDIAYALADSTGRRTGSGRDSQDTLIASPLEASDGHHGYSSPRGDGADNLIATTLTSGGHPNSNTPGRRREDDENLVAYSLRSQERNTSQGNGNYVTTSITLASDPIHARELAQPSTKRNGDLGVIQNGATVRRLTPTECERLQGFPDGWTDLGGTPDSPRYAALGDAVTVPVAEWIGSRILAS